jgi:hypothetical protein
MRIHQLIWPQDRIAHIGRHGVTPEEVEEVCFGKSLVLRAKAEGENPVYYVLGQTEAGRYLESLTKRVRPLGFRGSDRLCRKPRSGAWPAGFAARPSCRCLSSGSLHRGVQRSVVASLHATMQRCNDCNDSAASRRLSLSVPGSLHRCSRCSRCTATSLLCNATLKGSVQRCNDDKRIGLPWGGGWVFDRAGLTSFC